ncbi:MAG: response regulator [SAR324 cluster bacterium]|nr:response regulator [SAR324 cluster bacterium]
MDDEIDITNFLSSFLEGEAHSVKTVGNGNDGLMMCAKHPFDLAIVDLIMPDKEGLLTIFEMHEKFPQIKIIAMSGKMPLLGFDYLQTALQFGADACLIKPFATDELLDTITNVFAPSA